MKVEKRNGGFRVQKMKNGKRYSLTFDHKPTKAEIENALSKVCVSDTPIEEMTFKQAACRYTESKSNSLSPSTLRGYEFIKNKLPDWFSQKLLSKITQEDINILINELCADKSSKTVRNYHGFITAVFATYRPSFNVSTHLPNSIHKKPYIPTENDIKAIVKDSRGTKFQTAIDLLLYGLRRSEICALTGADVGTEVFKKNNKEYVTLYISKALVQTEKNKWIVKTTKTAESTREILILKSIGDEIIKNDCAFESYPNSITNWIYRSCDRNHIQRFSAHKFRHYFATKLSASNIPEANILEMGGWKTDHVMKQVYRHSYENKKHLLNASDLISNVL